MSQTSQMTLDGLDNEIPAPPGYPPYSHVTVWKAVVAYEVERWAKLRGGSG